MSADTIVPNPGNPKDLNRYAYTRNNPVRYVDPSGHVADAGGGAGHLSLEDVAAIYWNLADEAASLDVETPEAYGGHLAEYYAAKGSLYSYLAEGATSDQIEVAGARAKHAYGNVIRNGHYGEAWALMFAFSAGGADLLSLSGMAGQIGHGKIQSTVPTGRTQNEHIMRDITGDRGLPEADLGKFAGRSTRPQPLQLGETLYMFSDQNGQMHYTLRPGEDSKSMARASEYGSPATAYADFFGGPPPPGTSYHAVSASQLAFYGYYPVPDGNAGNNPCGHVSVYAGTGSSWGPMFQSLGIDGNPIPLK